MIKNQEEFDRQKEFIKKELVKYSKRRDPIGIKRYMTRKYAMLTMDALEKGDEQNAKKYMDIQAKLLFAPIIMTIGEKDNIEDFLCELKENGIKLIKPEDIKNEI